MLYVQAQYISGKKLKYSANALFLLCNKKYTKAPGNRPKTRKRIMPGIKKSLKGECAKFA
jgi:hypothetical protein